MFTLESGTAPLRVHQLQLAEQHVNARKKPPLAPQLNTASSPIEKSPVSCNGSKFPAMALLSCLLHYEHEETRYILPGSYKYLFLTYDLCSFLYAGLFEFRG